MSDKHNVINFDQELAIKNTEIFEDVTKIIGQLMKKDLAIFSFSGDESSLSFSSSPEVNSAFAHYSPQKVQSVTEEVVELTLTLLDNQEERLLTMAEQEGKSNHEIVQKKLNAIKQNIAINKMQNAYYFYRTTIGSVLEQFMAQRIVKPATGEFPAQNTVMVKLTTRDNLDNSFRESISFELYEEQLDEIIKLFTEIKKELVPPQQIH